MFKIGYDKKITMVQGDTGVIRMRISNYELSQGDEVRFAIVNKANPSILLCQHSDKKIVLEKQVTVFEKDGSARIVIYPYDTEYLQPGKYLYEIQVKTKDGRIDTVVALTSFTLMDGSIQGEYGQTTPSKPEPTPSEIELRFKRLENEIIPELGNRITNVEKEIDSVSSSLDNKANKTDGGLDRLNATSKFKTSMPSYIGLVNTAYKDDNATRFYLLPKAPVTSGVGGCLKIFADNYPEHEDYRDLGIYFHANQNGDKGYYGNGVNWINVKVLDGSKYDNKYPDIGFSFQDGKVVAGRITCFNGNNPIWVFGGKSPTSQRQGTFYIAEYQDNVAIMNEKKISFLKPDNSIGGTIRCNSNGEVIFSNSTFENHMIGGNKIYSVDENKVLFEKSTYHNSNIVITDNLNGVVLKSPNGSQFKIKVNDDGTLKTEKI